MVDCSTADLVVLHLSQTPDRGDEVAPYAASIPGIGEALELEAEAMAERITLLSALSTLKDEGLVAESTRPVDGLSGEHTVYYPTDAGRQRAAQLREDLADRTVTVENGESQEVRLDEVDRHLEEPAMVRALARLTDDGVLYLDEEVGERFVDRESELARLTDHLDAVAESEGRPVPAGGASDGGATAEGEARAVLIGGEAGVGKTTLASELIDEARDRGFRVLEGVCRRDAAEPYLPFRTALEDEGPSPFETADADVDDHEDYESRRTTLFADVVDRITDLAADDPLVVFVDDLHSADEATLELFEYVADNVEDVPALLVGTYRPEDLRADHRLSAMTEGWEDAGHDRVDLAPFGVEETRGLLQWVLGTRQVPESFVELVHDRTGGNALFVKESVRRMVDSGAVDPDYDVYPERESAIPIPERVEETVESRLEVLDDDGLAVLETASVVGESIPTELLVAAVELPDPRVRDYVDLLVDGHVFERTDDRRVRFLSGLIRETVAARIPDERREALHERIARATTDLYDDLADRHAVVAHHLREAGLLEEALEHYRQAAERDREVYAHEAAVENYEHALSVARELDDEAAYLSVLEELGRIHRLAGNHEEATDCFERIRDRADDDAVRRRVARYQSRMEERRGHYAEAIGHANRGLELSEDPEDPETVRLLCHKGWALMQQGKFDEAERITGDALDRAERVGDDELLGEALHNRASVEMARGTIDDAAIDMMERAVEVRERAGDRRGLANSLNNLGGMYLRTNDLQAAERILQRCLEMNEEMGDAYGVLSSRNNLGRVDRARGELERAEERYETVVEEARRIGARQALANALANLGQIYRKRDHDLPAALDYLERSLEIQREMDNTRWQTTINVHLAQIRSLRGDLEAGLSAARQALDMAQEAGIPGQRSTAHRLLGNIHRRRENYRRALDHVESALEAARENDQTDKMLSAHTATVEVLLDMDRVEDAHEHAQRAGELAEEFDPEAAGRRARKESAYANRALAQVHRTRGEYDRAVELLEDVLETVRAVDMDYYEPSTLYELGLTHRDRGDEDAAERYLRQARDRAEAIGATVYADQAREELREG